MFREYLPSKMNASDTIDLAHGMCNTILSKCAKDTYLKGNATKLASIIATAEEYQGRSFVNPVTEKLEELRTSRNSLCTGMVELLNGKVKCAIVEPEMAKKAQVILNVINETPVSASGSQAKRSNQTSVRIRRLNEDANRLIMEEIGVLGIFLQYKIIQDSIEHLATEKDAYESNRRRGASSEYVNELKTHIGYILPYLESNCATDPAQYSAPAKEIRETITRVMTSAKMRTSRKEDGEVQSGAN